VHTDLVLDAGAHHLVVQVRGVDAAHDHRLRLWCATGVPAAQVVADAAFGWVRRPTPAERAHGERVAAARRDPLAERRAPEEPLHRWIAVHGGDGADGEAAVLVSDGLAESLVSVTPFAAPEPDDEAMRDDPAEPASVAPASVAPTFSEQATRPAWIGVTLVRATGALSRADLAERPGHAGWPTPVPGAQGPGRFRATVALAWPRCDAKAARRATEVEAALAPHAADGVLATDAMAADATSAALAAVGDELADAVLRPLTGETWCDAADGAPDVVDGITLRGDGVRVAAIKPADDGDGIVLRLVNRRPRTTRATWTLPRPASGACEAALVRLDETPQRPLAVVLDAEAVRVPVTVPPRGVVSVRVRAVDAPMV
jgi:alpha-mannosidase